MTNNHAGETSPPRASFSVRFLMRVLNLPTRFRQIIERRYKEQMCRVAEGAKLHPECVIHNNRTRDNIRFGACSQILGNFVTAGHGGDIEIGSYCFIGRNSNIWSNNSIKIGDRVMISHSVEIHDTNSHSTSAMARHQHFLDIFGKGHPRVMDDVESAPVVIGSDCWIGFGATILKGVTIGEGSIVAARSVVLQDVPAHSVVAGVPARVIREGLNEANTKAWE